MKALFTIVFLFTTHSILCSQNILIGEWEINKIIGMDSISPKEYKLLHQENKPFWGYHIKFDSTGIYTFSYSAPCGNDCFPSSIGTFKIIGEKFVNLFVKEFHQAGECEKKDLLLNYNLGYFLISKQSNSEIKLIKQ